ncbi:MAG: UPF0175 family protein [Cyanobacteria bacterium P01_H01_bin.26]
MRVQLALPDEFATALPLKWGSVEKKLLGFAVLEAYRDGIISLGKLAELLHLDSRWDAEKLLADRGIELPHELKDFEDDLATLQQPDATGL